MANLAFKDWDAEDESVAPLPAGNGMGIFQPQVAAHLSSDLARYKQTQAHTQAWSTENWVM